MDRGGSAGPFKIVILGEGRVGKTSLLHRYVHGQFDPKQASTQSAGAFDKTIAIGRSQVKLALWDTAGQEIFHALAPIYYADSVGALIVYDVTDYESFKRCTKWVKELKTRCPGCCVHTVGNKCDLKAQIQVPQAEAEQYASSIGAHHALASAKSGQSVDETFLRLAEQILAIHGKSASRGSQRILASPGIGEPQEQDDQGCLNRCTSSCSVM